MNFATAIDDLVSFFSPRQAFRRAQSRLAYERIRGYDAGRLDRRTGPKRVKSEAGDTSSLSEVQRMRYNAWELYRNNKHARKVVRAITAQVVGKEMRPAPEAETRSGEPLLDLRSDISSLWRLWAKKASSNGLPGFGGLCWGDLQQQLLREVIVSGEALVHLRQLSDEQVERERRVLPFALDLIEADRLAEQVTGAFRGSVEGTDVFRGIEFDEQNRRVAYWIYPRHPSDPRLGPVPTPERWPAEQFLHVYIPDRINQHRGASWFSAALAQIRDIGDYQENELYASMISACVALGIKYSPSRPGIESLATPSGQDAVDADGNSLTRMQPGMIVNLLEDEDMIGFSPNRPNADAEGFMAHMLRVLATSFPGVKSSTITGDYRESSFSSERSADNDTWRETEQVQNWFAETFCQPVYETFLRTAIQEGLLGRVSQLRMVSAVSLEKLLEAEWRGPVPRTINPEDEENAMAVELKTGTASLQQVATRKSADWRKILKQMVEVQEFAAAEGIPESFINQIYGIMPAPTSPSEPNTRLARAIHRRITNGNGAKH